MLERQKAATQGLTLTPALSLSEREGDYKAYEGD